jgi:hypothetical protein
MFNCLSRPNVDEDLDSLIDGEGAYSPPAEEKLVDDNEMANRLKDLKNRIKEAKVDW